MAEAASEGSAATTAADTANTSSPDTLPAMDVPKESTFQKPSCFDAFAKWKWCGGPHYQFKRYYVFGEIDPCQEQWKDLKLCFTLKIKRNDEAEAMYKQRQAEKTIDPLRGQTQISTLGTVWEARTEPPPAWKAASSTEPKSSSSSSPSSSSAPSSSSSS